MPDALSPLTQDYLEKSYWKLQHLSTSSFALSGFSFTALSVLIGFFREDLQRASTIISVLLICAAIYLLTGEMAREAYQVAKYLFAETLYMFNSALLSGSFLFFVTQEIPIRVNPIALPVIVATAGYLGWRGIHNITIIIRLWKASGNQGVTAQKPGRRRLGLWTYLQLSFGVFIISLLYYVFNKLLDAAYGNFDAFQVQLLLVWILVFIGGFALYLWVIDRDGTIAHMLGARDEKEGPPKPEKD